MAGVVCVQVLREKAGEKGRNPYYGNGVVKMHNGWLEHLNNVQTYVENKQKYLAI